MQTYKIIQDESKLTEFINWLPELGDGEQFYVSLFCRKKYIPHFGLSSDKCQLKRISSTKNNLIKKIKQLEIPLGGYVFDDFVIPQEGLALYIMPNPRSMHKAGLLLMREMTTTLYQDKKIKNPKSLAMNCIQQSCSRKLFFDVDLDYINPFEKELYSPKLPMIPSTTIETRGGFHFLVHLDQLDDSQKKTWYKDFKSLKNNSWDIMMNGDALIPMPGTYQGGYTPILDI